MNTPRFLNPLSVDQELTLKLDKIDVVDVVERQTGLSVKDDSPALAGTILGLQMQKSQLISSAALASADFRLGDKLLRRATILADQGFKSLGSLEVEPHPDQEHSIIGRAYNARVHVWTYAPLGLVFVINSHTRDNKGELYDYLDHGRLYYRGVFEGGDCNIYSGNCSWESLSSGHSWRRECGTPKDLYLCGDISGEQLLFTRLSSILRAGRFFKKWPAIEIRHSNLWAMFRHPVEYGDRLEGSHSDYFDKLTAIGHERAKHFGQELLDIINLQPEWKSGDPQNAELADPVV